MPKSMKVRLFSGKRKIFSVGSCVGKTSKTNMAIPCTRKRGLKIAKEGATRIS